jgi:hypothetical protein
VSTSVLWNERIPLINPWSLGSVAVLLVAATGFFFVYDYGTGSGFGLIVAGLLVLYLIGSMLCCTIKITETELSVGVFPYRRKFPIADVRAADARALDVNDPPKLRWRKNGIGLPGVHLGWFSTSTARPVFAATAGKRSRVFIPTRSSHDVLVSSRSPERLVIVLHSLAR